MEIKYRFLLFAFTLFILYPLSFERAEPQSERRRRSLLLYLTFLGALMLLIRVVELWASR